MRILFCNYEYPPLGGGGGIVNAWLAQELAKTHEVTVLTSQGLGTPRERVEDGVNVIRVPVLMRTQSAVASLPSMAAYIPMALLEGRKRVKAGRFDVINTHFVIPTGPAGHLLAKWGQIPNVLSLHGGDIYDPSKRTSPHRYGFFRAWNRNLLSKATIVVGQSNNTIENTRRYYTPSLQATRIPLGIPRVEVESVPRSRYGFAEDETLLVTVGRLVARKNMSQLIAMMEPFKGERLRLLIIGTGPQQEMLQNEVEKRGLADQVVFMGYVEETQKFEILKLADLFVSSSEHEGFGLVFLEAMACGLPVICYDHGGQTDFLRDGKTGYLVPLNDTERFIDRCRSLLQDTQLRQTMSDNCQRRIEDFYIDNCARRYEDVFREAIAIHARNRKPVSVENNE